MDILPYSLISDSHIDQSVNVKVKFTLEQANKAQRGE